MQSCSYLKSYKVQEIVFSSIRSNIAYFKKPKIIKRLLTKNEMLKIKDVNSCSSVVKNKIGIAADSLIDDPIVFPHGFITWKYNTIYVTFRGVDNYEDLKYAIDIRTTKWNNTDAYIHNGFDKLFSKMREMISKDISIITDKYPIERLIFAGHSGGGALAMLSSMHYYDLYPDLHITCHTFGSPVVGDKLFVKLFTSKVDEYSRVEYIEDIVPFLPYNKQFVHIPNGIVLTKNGTYSCSTSLTKKCIELVNHIPDVFTHHACEHYLTCLSKLTAQLSIEEKP